MAERDPFGRRSDENPLAGLGWLSDETTSQAGQPVVVEAAEDWSGGEPAATAASSPPPRRAASRSPDARRARAQARSATNVVRSVRTTGLIVRLTVVVIVIGVIASAAGPLIDAGKDVRDAVGDLPSPGQIGDEIAPPSGSPDRAAAVPRGLSASSMLTRRNFARAIERLRKAGLGRARTLRVSPERIDAQLVTGAGLERSVQIRFDDPSIDRLGPARAASSQIGTIPYARIDVGAPARLARSAAGRARRPVSRIDYVVLLTFSDAPAWSAVVKGGGQFVADQRGRITRRIN